MAQTTLLYLSDTFRFEVETTVTVSAEDDEGPYIVTDATVFYPGGGGQEPDKGEIIKSNKSAIPILKAILIKGEIRHYHNKAELQTGDKITIRIDSEHRLQNARLHTGGHLLSSVVFEKLKLPLRPVKGFHYQQGAYIEFDPTEEEAPEIEPEKLHEALAEDIARELPVIAAVAASNDPLFQAAFKPEGFILPKEKPLRLVKISPYLAYPCGGTHLHHTGELNFMSIKHVKHKKGRIRISYQTG